MSGNARFTRGPITVKVVRRPAASDGLVHVSCGADPETSGYRCAYRGNVEQVIACLEACTRELWKCRSTGVEPEIQP
jgi:hypothetical protein